MLPRARSALLVALVAALVPSTARAIPAFARKYNVSCRTCHARAYPELNPFGRRFLENGYQMPSGAEEPARDRTMQQPGAGGETIGLLSSLPLAARAQSAIQIPVDFGHTDRNAVDFLMFEKLYLLLGGAVNKNVSFMATLQLVPDVTLVQGTMGLDNLLFGEGYLNFRAGRFLLLDFLRPSHRSLTRATSLGAQARIGDNPTVLDTTHLGLDFWGRLFSRRLFWELAVVQGTERLDQLTDLDSNKDVWGQLQLTFRDAQTIGAFGYWGSTALPVPGAMPAATRLDSFGIAAVDADLNLGPVTLFGYALYGRHDHATAADGRMIDYWGLRAEADVTLATSMLAVVRYDAVLSSTDPTLERQVLAAMFTHLPATNFKQSIEIDLDLRDVRRSTVYLLLDIAL